MVIVVTYDAWCILDYDIFALHLVFYRNIFVLISKKLTSVFNDIFNLFDMCFRMFPDKHLLHTTSRYCGEYSLSVTVITTNIYYTPHADTAVSTPCQ